MKACECQDWKDNMKYIEGALALARIHNQDLPSNYKYWEYCPWCGKGNEQKAGG